MRSFTQTLLHNTPGSSLATATHWDEIEIQEETEAGSSVTSKILLPGQVSESCVIQFTSVEAEVHVVNGVTSAGQALLVIVGSPFGQCLAWEMFSTLNSTGRLSYGNVSPEESFSEFCEIDRSQIYDRTGRFSFLRLL